MGAVPGDLMRALTAALIVGMTLFSVVWLASLGAAQPPPPAPTCEDRLRAERLLPANETCESYLRSVLALASHLQAQRDREEYATAQAISRMNALQKRLEAEVGRLRAELEKAKKPAEQPE